jgi:hypothetical protein
MTAALATRPAPILYGRAELARLETAERLAKIEGKSVEEMVETLRRIDAMPRVTPFGVYAYFREQGRRAGA